MIAAAHSIQHALPAGGMQLPSTRIQQLTWNSADDRYRSPKLGSTVTTSLPLFSGRFATCTV